MLDMNQSYTDGGIVDLRRESRDSYLFGALGESQSPGLQGEGGLLSGLRKRESVTSVDSNNFAITTSNAESAISPPSRRQIRKQPLQTPGFGGGQEVAFFGGGQNPNEEMVNTGENTSLLGISPMSPNERNNTSYLNLSNNMLGMAQ